MGKFEEKVNKLVRAFERKGVVIQSVVQHAQDLNQEALTRL